jgi:hypothetical protein
VIIGVLLHRERLALMSGGLPLWTAVWVIGHILAAVTLTMLGDGSTGVAFLEMQTE